MVVRIICRGLTQGLGQGGRRHRVNRRLDTATYLLNLGLGQLSIRRQRGPELCELETCLGPDRLELLNCAAIGDLSRERSSRFLGTVTHQRGRDSASETCADAVTHSLRICLDVVLQAEFRGRILRQRQR